MKELIDKKEETVVYKHFNGGLWVMIPGYPGYFANKEGDILGKRGNKLKKRINKYGYETVSMWKQGKNLTKLVHRLVASCFIYNKDVTKNQIDHINGVKHDNRVENLEWVTNRENQKRAIELGLVKHRKGESHHQSKLSEEDVRNIFLSFKTHTELSKKYNISISNIRDIRYGKIWKETTKNLDNSQQLLYLENGVRTLTIEEIRKIYISEGFYKDIAKLYNTSARVVKGIKNDLLCQYITKDLTPVKRGLEPSEVKYIFTAEKTYEELSKEFGVSRGYIENIKNGHMYRSITKNLKRGVKYKIKRLTKQQVIYIYTCSKTIKELHQELNISKSTLYAVRSQQNYKQVTENLQKGEW